MAGELLAYMIIGLIIGCSIGKIVSCIIFPERRPGERTDRW